MFIIQRIITSKYLVVLTRFSFTHPFLDVFYFSRYITIVVLRGICLILFSIIRPQTFTSFSFLLFIWFLILRLFPMFRLFFTERLFFMFVLFYGLRLTVQPSLVDVVLLWVFLPVSSLIVFIPFRIYFTIRPVLFRVIIFKTTFFTSRILTTICLFLTQSKPKLSFVMLPYSTVVLFTFVFYSLIPSQTITFLFTIVFPSRVFGQAPFLFFLFPIHSIIVTIIKSFVFIGLWISSFLLIIVFANFLGNQTIISKLQTVVKIFISLLVGRPTILDPVFNQEGQACWYPSAKQGGHLSITYTSQPIFSPRPVYLFIVDIHLRGFTISFRFNFLFPTSICPNSYIL